MHHHPLTLAVGAWWSLLAVTVHLDASALLVGLLPTAAVIVQHFLAKRERGRIASDSAGKVAEVHTLVNSQRDELRGELAERDSKIERLEAKLEVALRAMPPALGPGS